MKTSKIHTWRRRLLLTTEEEAGERRGRAARRNGDTGAGTGAGGVYGVCEEATGGRLGFTLCCVIDGSDSFGSRAGARGSSR